MNSTERKCYLCGNVVDIGITKVLWYNGNAWYPVDVKTGSRLKEINLLEYVCTLCRQRHGSPFDKDYANRINKAIAVQQDPDILYSL